MKLWEACQALQSQLLHTTVGQQLQLASLLAALEATLKLYGMAQSAGQALKLVREDRLAF